MEMLEDTINLAMCGLFLLFLSAMCLDALSIVTVNISTQLRTYIEVICFPTMCWMANFVFWRLRYIGKKDSQHHHVSQSVLPFFVCLSVRRYVFLSPCLSAWNITALTERGFIKFDIWKFLYICPEYTNFIKIWQEQRVQFTWRPM